MTVKELIKKLSTYDGDAEIVVDLSTDTEASLSQGDIDLDDNRVTIYVDTDMMSAVEREDDS